MSDTDEKHAQLSEEPSINFKPLVKLVEVTTKTNEEEEIVKLKIRAKLFRLCKETKQWKERGLGEVKILANKKSMKYRVLMRRDTTLKICANHYITKDMELTLNVGSDRSWVYKSAADFADEEPSDEVFAIRFASSEKANEFKKAFEKAQKNLDTNNCISDDEYEAKDKKGEEDKKTEEKGDKENKQSTAD